MAVLIFILLLSTIGVGQNYKPQLRTVDVTSGILTAAFEINPIEKNQFNQLVQKITDLNQFQITPEYRDGRQTGFIQLKSKAVSDLKTLESLFKQLEITTVNYEGKDISSQTIEANYKPVNKSEVRRRESVK